MKGTMSGPVARVHLELAGDPALVQLARLVATGVATSVGLEIDEAENCRAAVDEMCSSLIEMAQSGAVLEIDIVAEVGMAAPRIDVSGRIAIDVPVTSDEIRNEISEMILDAVTESHRFDVDLDARQATFAFVLVSRRGRDAPAGDAR
jgi:peptide deformylase